jgi:LysM repeat protein
LGCRGKQARIRIPHRLPSAAAPTLFGMAAAVGLSALAPMGLAGPAAAQVTAHHAAAADAASHAGSPSAQLLAATQPATKQTPRASRPATYTVRPGDSLSAIAMRYYRNPAAWPVLYWANHSHIRWANDIQAGQVLTIPVKPARIPAPPTALDPAPAPAPAASQAAAQTPAPAQAGPATSVEAASTYSGGTFGQCVIEHESGGNPQVMNASGHYGLYQFSASTWAAYGGSPADFGHASAAEQNQVFANAMAQGGQSNWAPYDGC